MLTAENVNTIIQDATQVIGEVNDNIYCRHLKQLIPYTKQWKEYLPKQLQRATNEEVVIISGGEIPQQHR